MNRTITMNLSGIIFHIEDDAYERLNKYLSTIKGYFNETEGRDEIMGDIESRIAEMLQTKVSQNKQAVLLADVESIIAVMGKPEDFASDTEHAETNASYRQEPERERTYRRLFRDPDDKVIGGVCSGISNYFDIDPIWIRGAFAIALFVFGSGVLLYCVLWMIIPVAKTVAEKLQMRGEKVDINSIGKAVNEEFNDVKKRMNKFGEDINTPERRQRISNSARSISHEVGNLLVSGLRLAGKIFSIIFLIISITLLTFLLAVIFGKNNMMFFDHNSQIKFSLYELTQAVLPVDISSEFIVTALILFIGIPLMLIMYRCVRYLFNIQQHNRVINYTGSVLWVIGIAMVIYIGVSIGNEFSSQSYVKKKISITPPTGKKLYLDVKPSDEESTISYVRFLHHNRRNYNDSWTVFSKEDSHYRLGYPQVDIVQSETDSFQVVVLQSAFGRDRKEASSLAKNISYDAIQKDSLLLLNNYFDISANDKFRAQNVKIIIKVPVNSSIYLSNRMERVIYDIDNVTNTLDADMVNRSWIMTREGLKCMDCTGEEATIDVHIGNDFDDDTDYHDDKHTIIRKDEHGETIETTHNGRKTIIHKTKKGETIDTKPNEKRVIIHKKIRDKDDSDLDVENEAEEIIIKKEIRTDENDKKLNSQLSIPFHLVPFSSGSKAFS